VEEFASKNRRETPLIAFEVLVYPHTNKGAHAMVVSILAYPLVCIKITSFQKRDSKRMLL